MSIIRWCVAAAGFTLAAGAAAQEKAKNELPDAVAKALEKAGEVEVYSIQPNHADKGGWRGYKVLGKTTVKKGDQKTVSAAVKAAVEEGVPGARCFIPRHGIRVAHGGKTYDLVICFECHWVYVFTDDSDKPTVLTISEAPQKAINKILTGAKIPLAKEEK